MIDPARSPKKKRFWPRGTWIVFLFVAGVIWVIGWWRYQVFTTLDKGMEVQINGIPQKLDEYGYFTTILPPWKSRLTYITSAGRHREFIVWPQDGTNDSGFVGISESSLDVPDTIGSKRVK